MRVLLAGTEAVPFSKTGGLGDVLGSLPKALGQAGAEVDLVTPLYGSVDRTRHGLSRTSRVYDIPVGGQAFRATLWRATTPFGNALLVECDRFFKGNDLYDQPDEAARFAFFSRVVAEMALSPPDGRPYDVVHANDWQTGPVAAHLRVARAASLDAGRRPGTAVPGTLFTIHNLAYQGSFPASEFAVTGLPHESYWASAEFYGRTNYLKLGLIHADLLSTVSERYAREILAPELGYGLEGVLAGRREELFGVLNGADYDTWNPETDTFLPARYTAANPSPKSLCTRALLREMGLPRGDNYPLAGCVSRLVPQKGFDLIDAALDRLLDRVRLVILGTGEWKYEDRFRAWARKRPDRLAVRIGYDEGLAHRIEAGADLFLMPSAYEPCGLNQIYSMRYGTPPVVRATGGLDDTVIDADADPLRGTGFKFERYDADEMLAAVDRAIAARRDANRWSDLCFRAMTADFSWARAAKRYLALYEKVREKAAAGR